MTLMTDEQFMAAAPAAGGRRVMSDEEFMAAGAPAQPQGYQPSFDPRQMPSTGSTEEFSRNLGAIEGQVDRYGSAISRTVGHNLLPSIVDQETPEQGDMFDEAIIQLLAAGAGAGVGGALTKAGSEALKFIGRGFQGRDAVNQTVQQAGRHAVQAGQPARTSISGQVAKAGSVGAAIDAAPDLYPGQDVASERVEEAAGGASSLGYMALRGSPELLLRNPRYRDIMMRSAGRVPVGRLVGAVAGYLGARALEPSEGTIQEAVDWVMQSEEK